ncbi:hypothetical protein [Pelagicoccus sp. SDUM812003]|uniref:hypothetical protein n=1 Tax=Pelagicoccus sp. SDUM812003 TaxID=3041267 RepID=UPI00280E1043|nr:hypothetical protein [Pelagicoccus sp. SDUM812003]MDQ8201538.1 hypothetical protein [Pelagicoccus sp. SDUM812003]
MNIDPRNTASHLYAQNLAKQNAAGQAQQASKPDQAAAGDKLELNALDKLRQIPEVRPEMVAKGKELLNDPNFPSKEMMNDLAKLIVPFADDE